jgi:hypothetical protein
MADQLYLSLWFPNFRFADLPQATLGVLTQFSRVSGLPRVSAAAAYPVTFQEPPVYQRVYVLDKRADESTTTDSLIQHAVPECMELLHEDTAFEFEMKWQLWTYEASVAGLDATWKRTPSIVKVIAFGPEFDAATYEQNGHIRVDFGLDTFWVFDEESDIWADEEARADAAQYIKENIEMLLAFTLSVEKHCHIETRLLWTESGEPLAEKLIARLQRLN